MINIKILRKNCHYLTLIEFYKTKRKYTLMIINEI